MTGADPTREASERMKQDHLAAGLPVIERNHNHTSRAPCGPSCPMPGLGWNGRGLVIDRFERAGEGAASDSGSTDPVETLHRIADQDIGGNAPWLADELKEVARKLELEWSGVYTGPPWDPCADCDGRGYHADGEPCATCFGSGQIPAGRKDADDA